jgi:S-formylglutathione hydrolase FrmB
MMILTNGSQLFRRVTDFLSFSRPEAVGTASFTGRNSFYYSSGKRSCYVACILFFFLVGFVQVKAATVDTVVTYSSCMHKEIKAVVIKPDHYSAKHDFPVVYLLHGYGGHYSDWIKNVPAITGYADLYNMIIVCPDGNVSSWYFDSPVDSSWKYETYVSSELVNWIDNHYATIRKPSGRAITGLSMGGHGAFYLAFRHQDIFGAAGSMSGGLDFRPFPKNWDIALRLGTYTENQRTWDSNTVINMLDLVRGKPIRLIFDCGVDDFFYTVNHHLHEKMVENKIPHDYSERPGKHTWTYWTNSIQYHLLFFNNFFTASS